MLAIDILSWAEASFFYSLTTRNAGATKEDEATEKGKRKRSNKSKEHSKRHNFNESLLNLYVLQSDDYSFAHFCRWRCVNWSKFALLISQANIHFSNISHIKSLTNNFFYLDEMWWIVIRIIFELHIQADIEHWHWTKVSAKEAFRK